MKKQNIYLVQFGTGASINLLPLAAGQLYSRVKIDKTICENFNLPEIIFRRPRDLKIFALQLQYAFAVGFSCFLWNMNISLQAAKYVKERFPEALIVFGGPSIPKDPENSETFLNKHPFIDVICMGEGEDVFVMLCHSQIKGINLSSVPGIIYRDKASQKIYRSGPERLPSLDSLPSPYLDGTFDEIYNKYRNEFSGIIWETNRGCPYRCAYCTWGNLSFHKIREKPMDIVIKEVEWIGRNKIRYIAMSDSNFGIRKRDLELAEMLAECKRKYGVPDFISVSWVKNSSNKVLKIANILKKCGIGFRVTLSLQSLNPEVLKAVNRSNIKRDVFEKIKEGYRRERLFSYTELILGLPLETRETFLGGLEESLSHSVYDQLYVYPCLLFPNTALASLEFRKQYKIEGMFTPNRYTKNKELQDNEELVEMVIGTGAMPRDAWRDCFVIAYYVLALHDDRLAFFILHYLKRKYSVRITDLIMFTRHMSQKEDLQILRKSFSVLGDAVTGIQQYGKSHLIEPKRFDGIPFDPPEGIFLELLMNKQRFYSEFFQVVDAYLKSTAIPFDDATLRDLFSFQRAVIAHPDGPDEMVLRLRYNWIDYFGFAFYLPAKELRSTDRIYTVVDRKPSRGNQLEYLKNHFDIRGIPAFNEIYDENGDFVFPLLSVKN